MSENSEELRKLGERVYENIVRQNFMITCVFIHGMIEDAEKLFLNNGKNILAPADELMFTKFFADLKKMRKFTDFFAKKENEINQKFRSSALN